MSPGSIGITGSFKNFNTIEAFKAADKTALFNQETEKVSVARLLMSSGLSSPCQIWEDMITTRDATQLNRFILITFADLKKYKYYYWFAFPAFVSKPPWEITNAGWRHASDELTHKQVSAIAIFLLEYH